MSKNTENSGENKRGRKCRCAVEYLDIGPVYMALETYIHIVNNISLRGSVLKGLIMIKIPALIKIPTDMSFKIIALMWIIIYIHVYLIFLGVFNLATTKEP